MGLLVKDKGFNREPLEAGIYPAVCYSVVDLGLQESTYRVQHKVMIGWELPTEEIEFDKDGETQTGKRLVSNFYTLSLNKQAKLRQHLEAWRGKKFTDTELEGFDLKSLIGVNCQLQIAVEDKPNGPVNQVSMVLPKEKGANYKLENDTEFFSFEDCEKPEDLQVVEWKEKLVKKSLNWKQLTDPVKVPKAVEQAVTGDDFGDDDSGLPF